MRRCRIKIASEGELGTVHNAVEVSISAIRTAAAAYSRPASTHAAKGPEAHASASAPRFGAAAVLQLSPGASSRASEAANDGTAPEEPDAATGRATVAGTAQNSKASATQDSSNQLDPNELSDDEQREVDELKARDQEVRTHEQAHKSAGGQYAGAIHLEYERGPDDKRYAVGGHVPIDVGPIKNDPKATIRKMSQVQRAALAPVSPSSADRQVASKAAAHAAQARADLAEERTEESQQGNQSQSPSGVEANHETKTPNPGTAGAQQENAAS